MSFIFGVILVAVVIYWLFRSKGLDRKSERPVATPAPTTRSRSKASSATKQSPEKPYATILSNGNYLPLSSEKVDALIAPIKADMREWNMLLRKLNKRNEKARLTLDVDEKLIAETTQALPRVRSRLQEINDLNDRLFFERDSSSSKFYKNVDDVDAMEVEFEEFLSGIDDIRAERAERDLEDAEEGA